jgi:hypothetical protein
MSPGLIVVVVLVAWLLGPLILRWAGALFAIGALLALVLGNGNEDQLSLLIGAIAGGLMLVVGIAWESGREEGRGPLIWSLASDLVAIWRGRRYRGGLRYAEYASQPLFRDEHSSDDPQAHQDFRSHPHARRGSFRRRVRSAQERAASTGDGRRASGDGHSPRERGDDRTVIDGIAHDLSASRAEDEASLTQSLREDIDRTLEEAHRCLEPIIYELFVLNGAGWFDRLNAARQARRHDLPALDGQKPFHDRRTLFSVIAHDWTLIGSHFMRDPSGAGRRLCAVANRYAHEGPREDDPATARRAFGEICAALRPQSVNG